jgi:hypothetical protein
MFQWKSFHKAIIVSGDGDFHCLIKYLYDNKKLKKIIVPNHKYSSLLKKFASKIISTELFRKKVEKEK